MPRNRLTLLEIVQDTLEALGSDKVDAITDTRESIEVASLARTVYYELLDRDEWPHLITSRQLTSVADTNTPNFLQIPEEVVLIHGLMYETTESGDTDKTMKEIKYLHPSEFLAHLYKRNTSETNVDEVTEISGSIPLWIINDQPPEYWTSFDDEYVCFDAYDSDVESTMVGSKCVVRAKTIPAWTESDSFVPDMPDQMFSTYMAELLSSASLMLKQTDDPKAEQRSRRGISRLRRTARKVDERDRKARYGRKPQRIYGSLDGREGSIQAQYWP